MKLRYIAGFQSYAILFIAAAIMLAVASCGKGDLKDNNNNDTENVNVKSVILESKIDSLAINMDQTVPYIEYSDSAAANKLNKLMTSLMQKKIDEFIKIATPPEEIKKWKTETTNSFWSSFDVYSNKADLVSIRLNYNIFTAGSAHPSAHFISVNYDLMQNKLLSLEDVFEDDNAYLEKTSDLVIGKLLKRESISDIEWVKNGAEASEKNYSVFNLTDSSIVFTFEPYQVAAYAFGPQEVEINFAELTGLLQISSAK